MIDPKLKVTRQKNTEQVKKLGLGDYKFGFSSPESYVYKPEKGLNEEVVKKISQLKHEPAWMLDFRLKSLGIFEQKKLPTWGPDLSHIDFANIYYYIKPTDQAEKNWDDVPADIKNTFDRLGIPQAERKYLAGVGAQYECLSGDTRVPTDHGPKMIRDLSPGNIVFAFDEERDCLIPAPVKSIIPKGESNIFEVRAGRHTIRATDKHPFLALTHKLKPDRKRGRYIREWKYLNDLKSGDLIAVAKRLPDVGETYRMAQPCIKKVVVGCNQTGIKCDLDISARYNNVELPEITSVDLMWWVGVYLGDGFIHHSGGVDTARVEFAIPEQDSSMRSELKRITGQLFGVKITDADPYKLIVYSTILARYLETNGLAGNAHTKQVPEWIFGLPEGERLAFLGGFVDADGYVRNRLGNHDVIITSCNSKLLSQLQSLAFSCGINTSSINSFDSPHPTDRERMIRGYRLGLSGEFDRIGCRSQQRVTRLGKRRYWHDNSSVWNSSFRKHTNEWIGFVKIDGIAPAGQEPVYDVEIAGPHNFVAEELIVHNSEAVYSSLKTELADMGVVFMDTDSALKKYPELVQEWFGKIIPPSDNKFSALNSATWSGGSFVYIPKGVQVKRPLQAYFRINAKNMGQFERTLIIADEGSSVSYLEGCTSPMYTADSLHCGVVEVVVKKNARVRYTTIQNWSGDVYNLVTKRARVDAGGVMEWVDGNIGSRVTAKYPSCYLVGDGARGEMLSIAYADKGQHQDTGAKMLHLAPNTSSKIVSKSISLNGGRTSYRGLVQIAESAKNAKAKVECDALILDDRSASDTFPVMRINESGATVEHEATVSKIGEDRLFYLMSRGLTKDEALSLIVNGFIEPIVKELPLEYAVELNRLIELNMEGSVG